MTLADILAELARDVERSAGYRLPEAREAIIDGIEMALNRLAPTPNVERTAAWRLLGALAVHLGAEAENDDTCADNDAE